ncbi:nucleotidyl transferase AbiEii/AbiGii toxin family protein [Proteiniphilum saccharofermentans]|uniref:nucleotidyl transferase AbiEii/AbiGii toxin family protein n=2 Tax=Proteiniphilum TaxID=294702 RepID=UPI0028A5B40F|nr:nucleotidyl transferase AbiEii/AbiGii toxin family protein [Proteiniphilum saccharofermentans]
MILQREILRIAEKEGVPPDTIDKNWVLGHVLAALFRNEWAQENLIFKGGTCLKKCYFDDYRFSEDLDFTLANTQLQITNKMLQSVCDAITMQIGILFSKVKIEPVWWNDMQVGYTSNIRFWGANHKKTHQPPDDKRWTTMIKIEIVHYEKIVNAPVPRLLLSNYSDACFFEQILIPCYSLTEVIAEKFRSLLQRSYPAPRDYYDLWKLLQQPELINWEAIKTTFKQKAAFKNIPFKDYGDFFEEEQIKK